LGTLVALTECEVERISAVEWYRTLAQDPKRYREAALALEQTLRKLQRRVEMTTVPKSHRIPLLKKWLSAYCSISSPEELLTQEEMGQFLGMSRETVNRYLKKGGC
jgi:CRP/FNR family cyclic AMP-dependent transcriptional regulator